MRRTLAAALVATPMIASAQPSDYIGIQYAQAEIDHDALENDVEPGAAILRAGTQITSRLGVEGRFGKGVSDDTISGVDVEIDRLAGIYATGRVPIGPASLYGVLGGTSARIKASDEAVEGSASDSGVSYGVGADIQAANNLAVGAEWMSYLGDDDYEASALSVGVTYLFQ